MSSKLNYNKPLSNSIINQITESHKINTKIINKNSLLYHKPYSSDIKLHSNAKYIKQSRINSGK